MVAWAADNLTPYRAISGNGDYGSDADDEALNATDNATVDFFIGLHEYRG